MMIADSCTNDSTYEEEENVFYQAKYSLTPREDLAWDWDMCVISGWWWMWNLGDSRCEEAEVSLDQYVLSERKALLRGSSPLGQAVSLRNPRGCCWVPSCLWGPLGPWVLLPSQSMSPSIPHWLLIPPRSACGAWRRPETVCLVVNLRDPAANMTPSVFPRRRVLSALALDLSLALDVSVVMSYPPGISHLFQHFTMTYGNWYCVFSFLIIFLVYENSPQNLIDTKLPIFSYTLSDSIPI